VTLPPGELLRVKLASDPRYLCLVRTVVRSLCALAGCDEARTHGITLAVDEACANVIRHAYGGATDGTVEVSFHLEDAASERRLVIHVLDRGCPPNPDRVSKPREVDPTVPGGLGLHFIRGVMDAVEFRTSVCGGNVAILSVGVGAPGKASPAGKASDPEL
jgi:anti-sigma regulatory factor (Ser/Thr protein kinase)